MSKYLVSIVRADGRKVYLTPGGVGERDLVEAVADAAVARGIGFLRTEAQVRASIVEAFNETLYALKSEVEP